MSQKLTYQQVKELVESKGYKLISDEYIDANTKLTIEDVNGYRGTMKYNNIKHDKQLAPFSISNPFCTQNIEKYIEVNNIKSKLFENKRESCFDNLSFYCEECSSIFETTWGAFKDKGRTKCKKCSGATEKITLQEMIDEIEKFYQIISYSYTNNTSRFVVVDSNGYKANIGYNSFKKHDGIRVFVGSNPFIFDNIEKYIENNIINTKLIREKSKSIQHLCFACGCGEEFVTSWGSFSCKGKHRCNKCSKSQSNIETKTENWLLENNFKFEKQVKFDGCKDVDLLRFDFKVYLQNEFVLIEVDGEMHYKEVFGNLENQQKKDKIKDEFCKKNNIKLIRIPYWNYRGKTKKDYIKILSQELLE